MRPDAEAVCTRALESAEADGLALIRGLYNPKGVACCLIAAVARPAVAAGSRGHVFQAETRLRLNATLAEAEALEAGWEDWTQREKVEELVESSGAEVLAAFDLGVMLRERFKPIEAEPEHAVGEVTP